MSELIKNAIYRVPGGRLMRYTGDCIYKGQTKHNFYFSPLKLFYWFDLGEVKLHKTR